MFFSELNRVEAAVLVLVATVSVCQGWNDLTDLLEDDNPSFRSAFKTISISNGQLGIGRSVDEEKNGFQHPFRIPIFGNGQLGKRSLFHNPKSLFFATTEQNPWISKRLFGRRAPLGNQNNGFSSFFKQRPWLSKVDNLISYDNNNLQPSLSSPSDNLEEDNSFNLADQIFKISLFPSDIPEAKEPDNALNNDEEPFVMSASLDEQLDDDNSLDKSNSDSFSTSDDPCDELIEDQDISFDFNDESLFEIPPLFEEGDESKKNEEEEEVYPMSFLGDAIVAGGMYLLKKFGPKIAEYIENKIG